RQHLVLIGRYRPGIVVLQFLQIWHRVRETWRIEKPTGQEAVPELPHIVHQELFGAVDIRGELPDEIALDAIHRRKTPHGPLGAWGASQICSPTGFLVFSAVRVMEIAFKVQSPRLPASGGCWRPHPRSAPRWSWSPRRAP